MSCLMTSGVNKTMKHLKQMILSLSIVSMAAAPLSAYEIPDSKAAQVDSANVRALRQFSNGVSELSSFANKAIVLISVSKIVEGRPYGAIDPFDFFFGPRFRPQIPPHEQRKQQAGLGSGFLVDLKKGYIITNNHVIEGADEISLKLANGKEYTGKVLGSDKNTDVAVVQIKDDDFDRKGLTQLHLADSDKAAVGEFVLALGAPFGLEASLSFGVISAIGRGNLNITSLGDFLQTDAAINPGNSGGPLIDMDGNVIGMNTAIYSRSGASAGIGFSVPANLVRKIANQLINNGAVARGYLGVQLAQDIDDELAAGLNLPNDVRGALIARVEPGTPADKAGIESGDVITKVEGKTIRSRQELTNSIGLLAPNTKVDLELYRNGRKINAEVKLSEFPNATSLAEANRPGNDEEAGSTAGLVLESLNPSLHQDWIQRYNIESRKGLLITDVVAGSDGQRAGLRPGDVLLSANRSALTSVSSFAKIYNSNRKILIRLERSGAFLFASLTKR